MDPLTASDPTRLGPWELLGRLGAGGMGVVYLGRDGPRTAAVKAVAPFLAGNADFRARFRREAQICATVTGPQVAELYGADPDGEQPWLAVRYVPGPTLEEAIAEHGPMVGPVLHGFALAVLGALRQIHSAGITHRDLKPSNVILTPGTPVIIDFGIASVFEATSLTATGAAMGSAGWMSPEQIMGTPTGPASDVFGWGALMAFASTGSPPFGVGRPEALVYRIVHGAPDLDRVPFQIKHIVARALAGDPAQRPSVDEIFRALGQEPAPQAVARAIDTTWVGHATTQILAAPAHTVAPHAVDSGAGFGAGRRRTRQVVAALAAVGALILLAGTAWAISDRASEDEQQATETTADREPESTASPDATAGGVANSSPAPDDATEQSAAPTTQPATSAPAPPVPSEPEDLAVEFVRMAMTTGDLMPFVMDPSIGAQARSELSDGGSYRGPYRFEIDRTYLVPTSFEEEASGCQLVGDVTLGCPVSIERLGLDAPERRSLVIVYTQNATLGDNGEAILVDLHVAGYEVVG